MVIRKLNTNEIINCDLCKSDRVFIITKALGKTVLRCKACGNESNMNCGVIYDIGGENETKSIQE